MMQTMVTLLLAKYINHKLRLSTCSQYYRSPELRTSLEWAYYMQKLLIFQRHAITEKDVARLVINNEKHLFKIIPCERNKSYKSSLENYHKIINLCKASLQQNKFQNAST